MSSPLTLDKDMLVRYGAGFMYYIEKHKLYEILSRLLAEAIVSNVVDVRRWLGETIRRVAQIVYAKALNAFHLGIHGDFYQLPKNFFHRIVLHGRPGSGRHSLAHVLAQHWNLLILDANVLAYHYIKEKEDDPCARQLRDGIEGECVYARSEAIGKIIEKRLLQEDALHRGWILVNYPNNSCEANELFEGFTVPPNRFVYLQISEHMARMRLLTRTYTPKPQDTFSYLDYEMQQFRKSEQRLNSYLSHRREVLYVDASKCFETVKCCILSQLTKTPYVLGYKYGESSAID